MPSIGVGKVKIENGTMTVGTGHGCIELLEVHPAGKNAWTWLHSCAAHILGSAF